MSGINGFAMNRWLDKLATTLAKIEGHVDEAEQMVKWDDSDVYKDEVDAKHARDDVRHVCSEPNMLRLDYLQKKLDHVSWRVREIRRKTMWIEDDIEEPAGKVGDCIAEEGTPEHREEVKDGLRDR